MNRNVELNMKFNIITDGSDSGKTSKIIRIYKNEYNNIEEFDNKLNNFINWEIGNKLNDVFNNMDIVIVFDSEYTDEFTIDKIYKTIDSYYDRENTVIFYLYNTATTQDYISKTCIISFNSKRNVISIYGKNNNELYDDLLKAIKVYIYDYLGNNIVDKFNKKCIPILKLKYDNMHNMLEYRDNKELIDFNDYDRSFIKNILFHKDATYELKHFNRLLNYCDMNNSVNVYINKINLVFRINKKNLYEILDILKAIALNCYINNKQEDYNIHFIIDRGDFREISIDIPLEYIKLLRKFNVCVYDNIDDFINSKLYNFDYNIKEVNNNINLNIELKIK